MRNTTTDNVTTLNVVFTVTNYVMSVGNTKFNIFMNSSADKSG